MLLDHPAGLWSFKRLGRNYDISGWLVGRGAGCNPILRARGGICGQVARRHAIWWVPLVSQYNEGLLSRYRRASAAGYDLVVKRWNLKKEVHVTSPRYIVCT